MLGNIPMLDINDGDFIRPPEKKVHPAVMYDFFAQMWVFLYVCGTPNLSTLFCGSRFRRAVQFNNNVAQRNGGGIAVDGGDVT